MRPNGRVYYPRRYAGSVSAITRGRRHHLGDPAMFGALPPSTESKTDKRPVPREYHQKQERLDKEKGYPELEQVLGGKATEGIAKRQGRHLVKKNFAACRKRPEHAHSQRVETFFKAKLHQRWKRCHEHRRLIAQKQVKDIVVPIQ